MNRIARAAVVASLFVIAAALGAGSAWWVLRHAPWNAGSTLRVGAWQTNTLAGSTDADLYTRARISILALLALGRAETMYYVATTDDTGRPLHSRCSYRVQGVPPATRWWSVTAYADDLYLFDAPNKQFSLNGSTAALDADGRFALSTGPTPQPGTYWLPTPGDRGVVLTLRLYNPSAELQAAPETLRPPSIVPVGACS